MTIFNLLINKNKYHPTESAISWNDGTRRINLSNQELWIELKKVISYLKGLGIQPGEKIGILANTSGYWHLADLGIMALGCTTVPIYPTASYSEVEYIIDNSDMTSLIIEDKSSREKFNPLISKLITISLKEEDHQHYFLNYKNEENTEDQEVYDLIKENVGSFPASIIYTSGTTSKPKGVVTSHEAIRAVLDGIASQMKGKVANGNSSLTCLPLSHVLGRCDSLLHLCLPTKTYFGKSPKTFMNDLKMAKPTFIITVPRIIDKIKERIENSLKKQSLISNKYFQLNFSIAEAYHTKVDEGDSPSRLETQLFIQSQKHFFSKIRALISKELKFLVSGGAKLNSKTYCFFRNIGIPILEGYGLTETFGPAFLNPKINSAPGFVGFPLPGLEMKFSDDSEILLKGTSVFEDYYKDTQQKVHTDDEGYFGTGDIGEWSIQNGLKITDRKKDIIVTSGGKNVAPAKIENLMRESPFISHFMLIGDTRKYLTGLISITKESFAELINSGDLQPDIEHGALSQHPKVIEIIESEVEKVNEDLASYEKVKCFYIIPISITDNSVYLSASLKLRKDKLYNKYTKEIDAMY